MFILSHVLYWLGCFVNLFNEAIIYDWPRHPWWVINSIHGIYSKLMGWSADLDKNERVWLTRHEGESEEDFERRVEERWPDRV